jgi:hypothetical protein
MVVSAPAPGEGRHLNSHLSKQELSPCRQQLLESMQHINFGRLEGLTVIDGEPVFDPAPRKQFDIKFGGDNGARSELGSADFLLKQQVVELFNFFDEFQNGVIDVLEIKHGLPFRMIVTEVPA